MRIANPIYDAVFKYLLEDIEIAKGMISRIIGEEIVELSFRPEEIKTKSVKYLVIILRIDFKAIIKTKEGTYKKVLIEIQKGKEDDDILRFRTYLGENYKSKDNVKTESGEEEQVLPIVPIYFLGFSLYGIDSLAVKVGRNYMDIINGQEITNKNDFIEKLSHDGYYIQLNKLKQTQNIDKPSKNALFRILDVFNQSYRLTSDRRLLEISEVELAKDPLLKKMIKRLRKAAVDTTILRKMEVEEQVESRIEKQIRKVARLEEIVQKQEKTLEQKERSAIEQLMQFSSLTNEQIAEMRTVSLAYVQQIRKALKN